MYISNVMGIHPVVPFHSELLQAGLTKVSKIPPLRTMDVIFTKMEDRPTLPQSHIASTY